MLKNEKQFFLYHGSYTEVSQIDLKKCYRGLDFGKGFYLTTSREQAISFVPNSIKKAISKGLLPRDFSVSDGRISKYVYNFNDTLKILEFEKADVDWLHFVAAHRNGRLFPEVVEKYADFDIVIGKIADDQTATTLIAYVSGVYGIPGSAEADEFAIRKLLPNKLKDQYCFRTGRALSYLKFVGSESYGNAKSSR